MFGFGKKDTFEIDGVEFTVGKSAKSAAAGKREIYCDGELVCQIERATLSQAELTVNGAEYSVMLIFESGTGNLSKVSVSRADA